MATKMTREEALKKVRQMSLPKETMEILEALAPELAESEDERIRRWLCDYFSSIDKAWIHKDITCIDILRWLEKQKEQKKEKFPPYVTGFKGHPDPAGTSDLEEAAKEYASKTLCDPDDGPSTGLAKESFIAGAEWQKEQKPAEKQDYSGLNDLERAIHRGFLSAGVENVPITIIKETAKECIAQMKPAEWSEEDEKDMAHIIRILDDCYVYGTHDLSKTDHENLVNKLKSLRPSWKPNEEQMKALYDACCIAFEEERDFHPSLSRLYHDLMKL